MMSSCDDGGPLNLRRTMAISRNQEPEVGFGFVCRSAKDEEKSPRTTAVRSRFSQFCAMENERDCETQGFTSRLLPPRQSGRAGPAIPLKPEMDSRFGAHLCALRVQGGINIPAKHPPLTPISRAAELLIFVEDESR